MVNEVSDIRDDYAAINSLWLRNGSLPYVLGGVAVGAG